MDKQIIGYAQPDLSFGFNNSFSFGQMDLSFFVDGQIGQEIVNVSNFGLLGFDGTQQLTTVRERWTPEYPSSIYPRLDQNNNGAPSFLFSDRFIEDGSFVRLQNVTLGFNFPQDVIDALSIASLNLYMSGTNLYTWTDYTGYNPDVSLSGSNTQSLGHDNAGYPIARTIRLGVKLKF